MDLFNLYSEAMLRELEVLPEFIIDNNFNNIRYLVNVRYIEKTVETPEQGRKIKLEERINCQL